jgi:cytochrome c553
VLGLLWVGPWFEEDDSADYGVGMLQPTRPIFVAVGILCTVGSLSGCRASPPGQLERGTAIFVQHHLMLGDRNLRNPLQPTCENIAQGVEAFGHYCVVCHGNDGQDTGVPFADAVSPAPPQLTSSNVLSYSDGLLKTLMDPGLWLSEMPASKGILSDDDQWAIALYLRHLPGLGALGESKAYKH